MASWEHAAASCDTSEPTESTSALTAAALTVRLARENSAEAKSTRSLSRVTAGHPYSGTPAARAASSSLFPRFPPPCLTTTTASGSGAATYSSASTRKASFIDSAPSTMTSAVPPNSEGLAAERRSPAVYVAASKRWTSVSGSRTFAASTISVSARLPRSASGPDTSTTGAGRARCHGGAPALPRRGGLVAGTALACHARGTRRRHRAVRTECDVATPGRRHHGRGVPRIESNRLVGRVAVRIVGADADGGHPGGHRRREVDGLDRRTMVSDLHQVHNHGRRQGRRDGGLSCRLQVSPRERGGRSRPDRQGDARIIDLTRRRGVTRTGGRVQDDQLDISRGPHLIHGRHGHPGARRTCFGGTDVLTGRHRFRRHPGLLNARH